jgi:hypothetical protein
MSWALELQRAILLLKQEGTTGKIREVRFFASGRGILVAEQRMAEIDPWMAKIDWRKVP